MGWPFDKKIKFGGGPAFLVGSEEGVSRRGFVSETNVDVGAAVDMNYMVSRQNSVHEHIGPYVTFFPENLSGSAFLEGGIASNCYRGCFTYGFNLGVGVYWVAKGYSQEIVMPAETASIELGYDIFNLKAGAVYIQRTNDRSILDPFFVALISINRLFNWKV